MSLPDEILAGISDGIVVYDGAGRITYVNGHLERMSGHPARDLVGESIDILLPAASRGTPETDNGRPPEARLLRSDGGELLVDVALSRLAGGRGPLMMAALRDTSGARLPEGAAGARVEQRALASAVVEALDTILTGPEMAGLPELIADQAGELAGAELAVILTAEQGEDSFVVSVPDGDGEAGLHGMRVPVEGSILGRALSSHEATVVPDLSLEAGMRSEFVQAADVGPAIFVPLALPHGDRGMLLVARRRGSARFSDDAVAVVRRFAAAAAVAITGSKAREAELQMVLLEERERVGRELHDTVIQSLFSVGLALQHAAVLSCEPEVTRRLEAILRDLDQSIADVRGAVFQLAPRRTPDLPDRRAAHDQQAARSSPSRSHASTALGPQPESVR